MRATTNNESRRTSRAQCGQMHSCGYLEIIVQSIPMMYLDLAVTVVLRMCFNSTRL